MPRSRRSSFPRDRCQPSLMSQCSTIWRLRATKTIVVTLAGVTSADPDVILGGSVSASVTIADDDVDNEVSIATTSDAAEPNQDGQFTVSLTEIATTDTVVTYSVAGTATSGGDYTALTGSVDILAGELSATIDVAVIDDLVEEGVETVDVTLTGVSGDANIVLGATDSASVSIVDDDVPNEVGVEATSDAAEPGTTGAFTVSLNLIATADVFVTYTVAGSAAAGDDYVALTGTATIPVGDLSTVIDVSVLDDLDIEGDETVEIMLTGVTSADTDVILGSTTDATVTLADDDVPNPVTVSATSNAAEPDQDGVITVSLAQVAQTDTIVTYSVAGTATPDGDYTALTGTVTIPAGDLSAEIDINVIDDLEDEASESVQVTVTGASGDANVTVGTSSVATVTIADNETPPQTGFSADFESGAEGFTYADGAFRGTTEPSFEDGEAADGVLRVLLGGGTGNSTITDMSGGWATTFDSDPGQVAELNLTYRVTMTGDLDEGEDAEVLVSIDGSEFFVAVVEATDDDDEVIDTGFVNATISLGTLSGGAHTITIGGFLNQRTRPNELATIEFDSIDLVLGSPSPADDDGNLSLSAPDVEIDASEVTAVAFDVSGIDADATVIITVSDGVNEVVSAFSVPTDRRFSISRAWLTVP